MAEGKEHEFLFGQDVHHVCLWATGQRKSQGPAGILFSRSSQTAAFRGDMAWAADGCLTEISLSLGGDFERPRMLSKPLTMMPLLLSTKGLCGVASPLIRCLAVSSTWTSILLLMLSVLVSSDRPNRIPETSGLLFSWQFWRFEVQNQGVGRAGFWWGLSFQLIDRRLLTVSFHGIFPSVSSSYKGTSPVGLKCTLMTSLNLIYLLKGPISKSSHFEN